MRRPDLIAPEEFYAMHPGSGDGFVEDETGSEIRAMDYLRLLWGKRWIILGLALTCLVLALSWALTRPKLYKATAEISVGERAPQIIKNQVSFGPNYWELERYVEEQVRVLETKRLAHLVVARLGLSGQEEFAGSDPAAMLLGMIKPERVKETSIISLNMVSQDPAHAAEWLNVFVDEYIALNIADNLQRTQKVYDVIQSKLDPLREQLANSEQSLVTFRERKGSLLFADQDKNVISEQINMLTTEYAKTKTERIRLETKLTALDNLAPGRLSGTALPEILQDPTISQLQQQKNDIEMEITQKSGTLKAGHPVMKDLQSRLEGVNILMEHQIESLTNSIRTDFEIVKKRESALYRNLQNLKDQSIELARQSLELERLQRNYDQNKAFLEDMLARSKETDISASAAVNNVRIIEPAEMPRAPFSPNISRSAALGLILGLFLGIGVVLALDFLDQTIRSPEQAERILGLEVLGVVPEAQEGLGHATTEALQALRTALILASRGEGGHVLVVTSAIPGEGKTTIATELAGTLARAGASVLLIDADLRKPKVHRLFDLENSRGLTTLMMGEAKLDDLTRPGKDIKGLEILTTGPLPPNPPELFAKPRFDSFLKEVRERYNWIVIDTPPIVSVTDPVICASHSDMALMVVRYATARHPIIRDALRHISRSGVHLAGILLNRFDIQREHYYSQYSYYRYAYNDNEAQEE